MNDRLGDIPAWAIEEARDTSDNFENEPKHGNTKGGGGDIEMGNHHHQQPPPAQAKHMEHFFREVESIKDDIENVKKATKQIGNINEAVLQATTSDEENELSRQLRPLVDATNKRAKRTKTLLGLLKDETKKLQDEGNIKQTDLRYASRTFVVEWQGACGDAEMYKHI
jgi:hypothetical protein